MKEDGASNSTSPTIGIVMGSQSDWPTMKAASDTLSEFDVVHETRIVSAHRTPDWLVEYARSAADRGLKAIIAGAGGAAHLPGMIASFSLLPIFGVPIESRALNGLDSLLSIVQMPGGVPVATFAIGPAGAKNAALQTLRMLATNQPSLADRLLAYQTQLAQDVLSNSDPRRTETSSK